MRALRVSGADGRVGKAAQHSSKRATPMKSSPATSPASSTSPAAAASPASSTKGVLGTTASKGTLPFTGLPLWFPALIALGLVATGFSLMR
jgi:hypothetical protein